MISEREKIRQQMVEHDVQSSRLRERLTEIDEQNKIEKVARLKLMIGKSFKKVDDYTTVLVKITSLTLKNEFKGIEMNIIAEDEGCEVPENLFTIVHNTSLFWGDEPHEQEFIEIDVKEFETELDNLLKILK